jgi:hypothetical protein
MTELYKKIKIINFEVIKAELLEMVATQISQNLRYWDVPLIEIYKSSPSIFNYIRENFYRFPTLFRFYNTPPFGGLGPHIDNLSTAKNKIGFNIPLVGTNNTAMNYYTTPEDNLEISHTIGFGNLPAQLIKDQNRLVLLDSFEVDQPTLLRTDVIHSISNPNDSYRLILGMKFIGSRFEEVYKG